MLLGLISDTHGYQDLVGEATGRFADRGVDRILHTGDVTQVQHIHPLLELDCPFHLVYGNCDFNTTGFEQAEAHGQLTCGGSGETLRLDGQSIALTHGHHDRILQDLLSDQPDYLIHGHTHERRDETVKGTRVLNPGAVKPPNPSVATLDLETDEVTFYELSRAETA